LKKWTLLEQVTTPDGSTLSLAEHDGTYAIRVNGRELMSSRHSYSEEQLGVVACRPLCNLKRARVLIGGLGLGFTLRAALSTLGSDARVLVAELLPEVVAFHRNPAYALAAPALADPRTELVIADVARVIESSEACFDAIMLDADNQTTSMNTAGNARLYRAAGLAAVHRALTNGGTAVYWSAGEEPAFVERFRKSNFDVEVRRVARHPGAKASHFLLIGRRTTDRPRR
jgi:spermidine synthase